MQVDELIAPAQCAGKNFSIQLLVHRKHAFCSYSRDEENALLGFPITPLLQLPTPLLLSSRPLCLVHTQKRAQKLWKSNVASAQWPCSLWLSPNSDIARGSPAVDVSILSMTYFASNSFLVCPNPPNAPYMCQTMFPTKAGTMRLSSKSLSWRLSLQTTSRM